MILQVWFYAALKTFIIKCTFNSKNLALPFENFWLRHCRSLNEKENRHYNATKKIQQILQITQL